MDKTTRLDALDAWRAYIRKHNVEKDEPQDVILLGYLDGLRAALAFVDALAANNPTDEVLPSLLNDYVEETRLCYCDFFGYESDGKQASG